MPVAQCAKHGQAVLGACKGKQSQAWRSRGARRAPLAAPRAAAAEGPCPSTTVERCLQLFSDRQLDRLVELLPDSVVDGILAKKCNNLLTAPVKDLSFADLLDLSSHGDFSLDAYAQRSLLLAPPGDARMLSALRVSGEEFVQRFAITAASGEEQVVTFRLALEDALEGAVRSVHFKKEWHLRGITGEPASTELPTEPHPRWGPESVVKAQLGAFRDNDLATVYRFASPHSQLLSGSYERFMQMMANAVYRPLAGHSEAQVLRSVQMGRDRAFVLVGVTSNSQVQLDSSIPRKSIFAWTLRLQDARQGGGLANCWLTDGVQPFTSRLFTV